MDEVLRWDRLYVHAWVRSNRTINNRLKPTTDSNCEAINNLWSPAGAETQIFDLSAQHRYSWERIGQHIIESKDLRDERGVRYRSSLGLMTRQFDPVRDIMVSTREVCQIASVVHPLKLLSKETTMPTGPHQPESLRRLQANLGLVIRGKPECLEILTIALLAGGSVLMEDVPGVGKTTLAKALAKSVDLSFNRVQFTPDLLPSDILGSSIYNPVDGKFNFRPGPIFSNVLLADEINRASPRTQSALLEAMSESQATIEGTRHPLPDPFLVLATENPVEFHGTYPLPEAQLDRFLVLINLGYPDAETELQILYSQQESRPLDELQAVLSHAELLAMQREVCHVQVSKNVGQYMVDIVGQTRRDSRLRLGVSPRGTLMLFRAAQASAFLNGRKYVLPDDVQTLSKYVLPHRIMLTSQTKYGGTAKSDIIADIVKQVPVPL